MRFKEFKILLEDATKFYTIGDSHAVAVAQVGGKNWVNLAIGGKSSTDSAMLANIAKVPKGATVLVSQGANDTANAMRLSMETKKPPRDPNQIATNVANVVNKVQAQGATVIFMLFPNGPGRGPGLAKYYGGDYQEAVRTAIKSAIGDVKVIDLNGKPLTDGVHATMGTYLEVANQVASGSSKSTTAPTDKPRSQSTSTTNTATPAVGQSGKQAGPLTVPVNLYAKSNEVKQIQQALMALGYPLSKYGADSVFGPETAGAVRRFQKDNSLKVDGDPGPETVGKLNELLKNKGITSITPVPQSGKIDPNPSSKNVSPNASGQVISNPVNPEQIVSYLKSKGLSANHIVGMLANIEAESSFDSAIFGDGGTSGGLFQHHDGRDVNRFTLMRKAAGPNWQTNWKGQIDFALSESEGQQYLSKQFKTPEEASQWFTIYFEVPEHKETKAVQRSQNLDRFVRLV